MHRSRVSLAPISLVLACAGGDATPPTSPAPADGEPAQGHHGHGGHHGHHGHDDDGQGPPLGGHHRAHGTHHRFDDPERWAQEFDSEERIAWQKPDAVIAALALPADATIVDLGAGTGAFAMRFARALPRGIVYANDIEATMVDYLGARAKKEGLENVRPILGSAEDPKIPAPVDLAFMCDVFHHIDDVPGFFGKVKAAIKGGGRLVIVDFKKDAPEDAPGPPKAMRVAAAEVIAKLTAIGFEVVSVDEAMLEYQYVIVMRRP